MKHLKTFGLVCTLIALMLGCGGDNGVTPPANQIRISSVMPNTLGLGAKAIQLTISGSGFAAGAIADLGPGIEILSVDVPNSTEIRVTVNVTQSAAPGPRTVIVRVGGQMGQLESGLTVSDDSAPIAKFSISPSQGTISTLFEFDAGESTDDGRIESYKWEFSDGSSDHGMRVPKQFKEKGSYTVRLTVKDDKDHSSVVQRPIEVGDNLPPEAVFTVDPLSGTNLTTFTFDASASSDPDGNIAAYKWTFTDNGAGNGVRVERKFQNTGDILVQLEVQDNKGAVSLAKKTLKIGFFDVEQARKEISDVVVTFLKLFANLENLSAEDIVVGFSRNCNGREREIRIIEDEQALIRRSGVTILGDPSVSNITDKRASASVTAEFHGEYNDGTEYSGVATHHLTMVNENGEWKICDFYVTQGSSIVSSPILPGN